MVVSLVDQVRFAKWYADDQRGLWDDNPSCDIASANDSAGSARRLYSVARHDI